MKLLNFLVPDATVADLVSTEKEDVIRELVAQLVAVGALGKRQAKGVVATIMEREALGTTGIGRGVAVPHGKRSAVKKVTGCLGRSKKGINFAAIDGEPVYLVFLLISPLDEPELHLKALEQISIVLRDENFPQFLKRAKDRDELMSLLHEADEELLAG